MFNPQRFCPLWVLLSLVFLLYLSSWLELWYFSCSYCIDTWNIATIYSLNHQHDKYNTSDILRHRTLLFTPLTHGAPSDILDNTVFRVASKRTSYCTFRKSLIILDYLITVYTYPLCFTIYHSSLLGFMFTAHIILGAIRCLMNGHVLNKNTKTVVRNSLPTLFLMTFPI